MARKKTANNPGVAENVAKVKEAAKPGVELGGSGTLIMQGIISGEDYARELTGLNGIKAYEEMRNDATVNASLDVIKLPILAANWYIEAGNDEEEKYKEHAEFIKQELFSNTDHTFTEFLREALLYLDYGRYAFEIVYRLRSDGRMGWQKFAPRMPKTIYYWETKEHEPGIQQLLPDGNNSSIPAEKLIIFINRKEGDNFEGRSILRSSYRNWYTKNTLYQIQAIALERQGVGIPYVKAPSAASKRDIAKAEEFLRNLRANEESFLSWKEGWEFGFMDMHSNNMDPSGAIAHHNREIVKNVLAQFLELGASNGGKSGATGSHALSKDQSNLLILSLQYVSRYVADIISKEAIRRLIDINFGPQEYYPKLYVSKIQEADFGAMASALQSLVTSTIITPDPGLEDFVRDTMNLPELPESVRAEMEFDAFNAKMEEDDLTLQAQEEALAAEDAAMEEEEPDEETEPEEDENTTAAEDALSLREVMGVVFTGAAGTPLSEEHRKNISLALQKYWAGRKKTKTSKGKKGRKGRSKLSDAEKAARKESRTKVKALRTARRSKVKTLRIQLRKKKMAAQQKIMERKMKGDNPTKEDYARMKLDLLKAQSAMYDAIDKIDMDTDKQITNLTGSEELHTHMGSVVNLKEEVDNVIEKLQSALGETD